MSKGQVQSRVPPTDYTTDGVATQKRQSWRKALPLTLFCRSRSWNNRSQQLHLNTIGCLS